jgi:hypothetical protein
MMLISRAIRATLPYDRARAMMPDDQIGPAIGYDPGINTGETHF